MIKRTLSVFAFSAILALQSFGQAKLVEKVIKKGNEIVIPYEKYVLPNGLTIVIHEDHSDPIVYTDVTYHVGSAREEIGRSGFAHFFEHMMFQGSDNVADEEHFKFVTEAGGTLNGTTNTDRTNYFETLPSNKLETALWLEADRMGFLLDAVTQQKFEVQRATVKNERGQRVDNQPYGRTYETVSLGMFPKGHPYNWPTIGWMEDLDRADVNDLKAFFLRWYGPNNATLTVAGDVKTAEVLKLATKYFGSIPRGPEVKKMDAQVPVLDQDRYISYEDNIRFPLLMMAFPTTANYSADEPALDILSDIIGGGKNSILYQNLVKSQQALQASASNPSQELSGMFSFTVLPFPGKSLADMEAKVREAIAEFERRGVNDEDLKKYKATHEANMLKGLQSVQGKGAQLAAFQTFTGNPNYITKELERYNKVSKEDVVRVFNKYIKGKPAVILSVYPKGKKDLVARPDNFPLEKTPVPEKLGSATAGLVYVKAKDSFDRSKKPGNGPNPVVKVPALYHANFANGLKVIGTNTNELPMVTLQLSVDCGHIMEANEPNKAGIAALMAGMLEEATQKSTAEQIEQRLELLGSSIDISSGKNSIDITLSSLSKNLDATLNILKERLFEAKFAQADFDRLKKQQLEGIANQTTQPTTIANNIYNKLMYGENHIFAIPNSGTETTVTSITLDDVKAYYAKYFSPNIATLVVVGDLTKEGVNAKLGFLKDWKSTNVAMPKLPAAPKDRKTVIYLVDKENAPQSEIRVGYMTDMKYDATGDYFKSTLMNYVLGGAFNSHINLNLREDKGWTYGARSYFASDKESGPFTVSGGFKAVATDSTVMEIMKELKDYREKGINDEELAFTKNSIGQSDALKYETPIQKAVFLKRIVSFNLPDNYVDQQNEIVKNISKEEINRLAKKDLPIENMVILAVGDAKTNKAKLEKLGYPVVMLDKEGKKMDEAAVAAAMSNASFKTKSSVKITKAADGSYEMPVEVNGEMKKASIDMANGDKITMSVASINEMMKSGKLLKADIMGLVADGSEVNLKSVKLAGKELSDVKVKVVSKLNTQVAMGPMALMKFGKFSIDQANESLIFE